MSKIICDVCGTSYPESANQCPICGCVRSGDAVTVRGDTNNTEMNATGNLYIQVKMIPYDDYYANVPMQNISLNLWTIPDGEILKN